MAKKLKIEKSKKQNNWNFFTCKENILDTDMILGTHTEIFGNGKINIEGCMGVLEYTDTYLKLKLQKGTLILCGDSFDIIYFEEKLITVKGVISSVEFCV